MSEASRLNKLENELKNASKDVLDFINVLTDEKSFVECDRFLRSESALGSADGEGVVSGFASIGGADVGLFVINPAILKGSIGVKNSEKIVKCLNNAVKCRLGIVGVFDTSGARFAESISAVEGYGKIIKAYSDAYGEVPVITVIKGNSFGLSSYLAAMSDFCIAYDKSLISTSSPLIVSAKAGTDIKNVGTSAVHLKSGLYSAAVKTDKELKELVSRVLNILTEKLAETGDDAGRASKALKAGATVDTVVKEIFDKDSFIPVKKDFAPEAVTGFARLGGAAVGVIATNAAVDSGRITSAGAEKIETFIYSCACGDLPIINIVNSKGAVNSLTEENGSLIRRVADMMFALSAYDGAKIALITGDAFGAAYTALASKSYVDYSLAWDSANIGAIDGAAAAQLLYGEQIAKAKNKDAAAEKLAVSYAEENTSALVVAAEGYIDNVIDPQFSRQYLISALQNFMFKVR